MSDLSLIWTLLKTCLALAILIPAVAWTTRLYARRIGGGQASGWGHRLVRVIDVAPLGPQRTVAVVDVAGRILVLGSTQQSITLLAEITDAEQVRRLRELGLEPAGLGFAEAFRKARERWGREREARP